MDVVYWLSEGLTTQEMEKERKKEILCCNLHVLLYLFFGEGGDALITPRPTANPTVK